MITTTIKLSNGNEITVSGTTLREFEYKLRQIYDHVAVTLANDRFKDEPFTLIPQYHPDHNFDEDEPVFIKVPTDLVLLCDLKLDLREILALGKMK